MQTPTSPVPRNSPLTVTTTTRYESSSRNHVSSPRNYSLSPTSQIERASPVNYVPASTQRVASPISMQRVTSPITTITHRVTTPLTSPLTVKVISALFSAHYVFPMLVCWTKQTIMNQQWQQTKRPICLYRTLKRFLCSLYRVEPAKHTKRPKNYHHTKHHRTIHHPMTLDEVHRIRRQSAYLVLVKNQSFNIVRNFVTYIFILHHTQIQSIIHPTCA